MIDKAYRKIVNAWCIILPTELVIRASSGLGVQGEKTGYVR